MYQWSSCCARQISSVIWSSNTTRKPLEWELYTLTCTVCEAPRCLDLFVLVHVCVFDADQLNYICHMPASRLCGACFCGAMIACVGKSVGCFCYRNEQGWKSWNKHEWKLKSRAVGTSSKALGSVWQPCMLPCCHPVKLQFENQHLCHFCFV